MPKDKESNPAKVDKKATKVKLDKKSKSSDDTKSKSKGSDKLENAGEKTNAKTRLAELTLNVNTTGRWLAEYYTGRADESYIDLMQKKYDDRQLKKKPDDEKTKKDKKAKGKDETTDDAKEKKIKSKPTFRHCDTALTIVEEVLCLSLINLVSGSIKKEKSGMYTVTEDQLVDSVKLNNDFFYTFSKFLNKYDSGQEYSKALNLPMQTVTKFIEKFAFTGGNANTHLTHGAYNFLLFILLKNRIMLADTAFQVMKHGEKYAVNYKCMETAVNIHYAGTLRSVIAKKLDEKRKLVVTSKTDDNTSAKSDEKPDKKSDKKTDKNVDKKSGKKSKDESEDEASDESENESSESSAEESDESDSGSDSD